MCKLLTEALSSIISVQSVWCTANYQHGDNTNAGSVCCLRRAGDGCQSRVVRWHNADRTQQGAGSTPVGDTRQRQWWMLGRKYHKGLNEDCPGPGRIFEAFEVLLLWQVCIRHTAGLERVVLPGYPLFIIKILHLFLYIYTIIFWTK